MQAFAFGANRTPGPVWARVATGLAGCAEATPVGKTSTIDFDKEEIWCQRYGVGVVIRSGYTKSL